MGRSPCCEKVGLKKGPWTPEEDQKLMSYIEQHGHGSWRALPSQAGLQRCGKSCRLRWTNYLRPDIKRGKFSLQEERTIIQLHALLGNRWSAIAAHLAKRTDNEIKNYWNTHLKKRLTKMGIDPTTHKPKTQALGSATSPHYSKEAANLSHMAQWESARLEAEARLVRDSKLHLPSSSSFSSHSSPPARLVLNKIPAQPPRPPCLDVLKAWQNSWSLSSLQPLTTTTKDKTTGMHGMYALMLAPADVDDVLESPTSTLSFPETMLLPLPPISTTSAATGLTNESVLAPAGGGEESWGCLGMRQEVEVEEEGERRIRMRSLEDDDIMVAVEAFMGERYHKNIVAEVVPSSSSGMEGVNVNGNVNSHSDDFDDVLVYDSNDNLATEQGLGFMGYNNDSICGNVNFEDKNCCSWNGIYTELGRLGASFTT